MALPVAIRVGPPLSRVSKATPNDRVVAPRGPRELSQAYVLRNLAIAPLAGVSIGSDSGLLPGEYGRNAFHAGRCFEVYHLGRISAHFQAVLIDEPADFNQETLLVLVTIVLATV
jgi:hypothetical protein